MTKPNEPTLTCSEVVERLAKLADETFAISRSVAQICREERQLQPFREKATAILHSWRERRVQELEEALRMVALYDDRSPQKDKLPESVMKHVKEALHGTPTS